MACFLFLFFLYSTCNLQNAHEKIKDKKYEKPILSQNMYQEFDSRRAFDALYMYIRDCGPPPFPLFYAFVALSQLVIGFADILRGRTCCGPNAVGLDLLLFIFIFFASRTRFLPRAPPPCGPRFSFFFFSLLVFSPPPRPSTM